METSRNNDPLVSICIPVFNAGTTISRTLDSILGQTYQNLEIIVVDNLSTDETLERVREFSDPRIRIVENPVHFDCGEGNWNTCFAHANGEFIALFHADDMYSPDMVARQVDTFIKFPSVMGVFTNAAMIDDHDKVINLFSLPPKIAGDTLYGYLELLPMILEYDNFFLCPSAMIRGNLYKRLAPFRFDRFGYSSDLDMWLRVTKTGPVMFLKDRLLNYRIGTTGWSFNLTSTTRQRDFFRVMDFHIAESGMEEKIPGGTRARYELRRMEDQVLVALNFVKRHDFSGFREHIRQMAWGRYLRIIILKPWISLPVLIRGFFKLLNYLFMK